MKIGDLAAASGVTVRLLRYYEEQGLLTADRTTGGQRTYADDAPDVVARIRLLLDAGLPTKVIRDVLPCFVDDARLDACVRDHLRTRLTELDERIGGLQQARTALSGLLAGAVA
ncbi:MAG: MerR family transcriptional regulator [Hamadaea sp.]|nr:MerR family transcriptional regulator [Hamadaea sp.]